MKMETWRKDVTGKTVLSMDLLKYSMKMETLCGELTVKTANSMDFRKISIKTEKQNQLNNM
jgi:hypothetical protein